MSKNIAVADFFAKFKHNNAVGVFGQLAACRNSDTLAAAYRPFGILTHLNFSAKAKHCRYRFGATVGVASANSKAVNNGTRKGRKIFF